MDTRATYASLSDIDMRGRVGFIDRRDAVHAAIRRDRRPLPSHDLHSEHYRRWATAVCGAEVDHARADWYRIVHRERAGSMFDEDKSGPSERYRLYHEACAATVLDALWRLETAEMPIRESWARDAYGRAPETRAKIWQNRRRMWRQFMWCVEAYRVARRAIDRERIAA